MKLDKKLLYRHIVELQMFRNCYSCYSRHKYDGTQMFKVRKLVKDGFGNMSKFVSFALSSEGLPKFIDVDPIINYDVVLLTQLDIDRYISQCKSYGIDL